MNWFPSELIISILELDSLISLNSAACLMLEGSNSFLQQLQHLLNGNAIPRQISLNNLKYFNGKKSLSLAGG